MFLSRPIRRAAPGACSSRLCALLSVLAATLAPGAALAMAPTAPAVWSAATPAVGPGPDEPGDEPGCRCHRNLAYGPVSWLEPTTGRQARQEMDVWMPDRARWRGPHPVVYFGHANGADHSIAYQRAAGSMWSRFVKPLTDAGYIVVSYEFRHPVVNYEPGRPPPGSDIRRAINHFARVHARVFDADTRNSFITGSSRGGGLGLLTALGGRFAGGTVIRAVRVFQAQTTFDCREAADTFVVAPEREAFVAGCHQVPAAGSALQAVDRQAPPVHLAYDQPFRHTQVPARELNVHFPDQGLAFCRRQEAAGAHSECVAADEVPGAEAWDGLVGLFERYRVRR